MRLIILSCCLAALLPAQAIVEHAIAAGVGSAAAAGGKKLSEGVEKLLGKTSGLLGQAAKTGPAGPATPVAPERQVIGSSLPPLPEGPDSTATGPAPRVRVPLSAKGKVAAWELLATPESVDPAAVEPTGPSADEIAKIEVGLTRDHVLAKLGRPSARVLIPEDGGMLLEIYSFNFNGAHSGKIRLLDGAVTSVEPYLAR